MSLQRNPLPPRRRRLIFGMLPWMLWTLLAAVVFALGAPFAQLLIRRLLGR